MEKVEISVGNQELEFILSLLIISPLTNIDDLSKLVNLIEKLEVYTKVFQQETDPFLQQLQDIEGEIGKYYRELSKNKSEPDDLIIKDFEEREEKAKSFYKEIAERSIKITLTHSECIAVNTFLSDILVKGTDINCKNTDLRKQLNITALKVLHKFMSNFSEIIENLIEKA